jgi:hypothetical protein
MSTSKSPAFFVGYLKIPAGLRPFLLTASILFFMSFSGAAILIGATQDDPGKAGFRFDYGRQTVTGVVELKPYPLLRVTKGNDRIDAGHTLMLTGSGKAGVMGRAAPLDGKLAQASGVILKRGDLDMLQLRGGKAGLKPVEGDAQKPTSQSLGKWRLAGEICDGKCLAGAMQPGRGLAHKACANLCLIGGIPPVFVSSQPVEGSEFILLANKDGGPVSQAAYDHIGQFIHVEGELERRGDMLVLKMDATTIELAQ